MAPPISISVKTEALRSLPALHRHSSGLGERERRRKQRPLVRRGLGPLSGAVLQRQHRKLRTRPRDPVGHHQGRQACAGLPHLVGSVVQAGGRCLGCLRPRTDYLRLAFHVRYPVRSERSSVDRGRGIPEHDRTLGRQVHDVCWNNHTSRVLRADRLLLRRQFDQHKDFPRMSTSRRH
jgi:hypothetical protein